ncbi:NAD(P)H-binding protein [Paenibacillus polysaccharolyticus]|uniref:NmrA family NAD(P)-binding protein n=1 Tax=Paenibacillus polysaccharolyticus TaxID=582692 RepID=UPI00203C262F|nr:NAD(P)H-binding protein [Paenibacillus polysaccharolyticus]MCM3132343.1 NAD(P)H-binding protein [Paenibacillus polysaccharolyticus]
MSNEKPLTLITGASGKTGSRVAAQLQKQGYPVRLAGRKLPSSTDSRGNHVYFDWYDPATYGAALKGINQIYLVVPQMDMNPEKVMVPFIQEAIWSGVKRFVLLGRASVDEEGPVFGKVHQALKKLAPEWAVLRPSYFMENFTEGPHRQTIAQFRKIYSATGEGRIGFVSADDIAAAAFHALTDTVPHNREHIITGPESLSYAEVALKASEILNQPIQHESLSEETLRNQMIQAGMPEEYATMLAGLDTHIREDGREAQVTDTVLRVTGKLPLSIEGLFSKQMMEYHSGEIS